MSIRIPVGATVVKVYYVVLPFEGANQAAGQVIGQTETDNFREARDIAIGHYEKSQARARRTGHIITNAGRPRLVHRYVFEFPEGGSEDIELERVTLTNDVIEAAANGY